MKFITLTLALLVAACGAASKDDNCAIAPYATDPFADVVYEDLGLPNMTHSSLRDYDVKEQCNVLEEALIEFARAHMDGVEITVEECKKYYHEAVWYDIRFSSIKHEEMQPLRLDHYGADSEVDVMLVETETSYSGGDYLLAKIHPNLIHLGETIKSFIGEWKPMDPVFGHAYDEFMARVSETLVKGGYNHATGDNIKLELLIETENSTRGRVKFHEVPSELFELDGGFLGCSRMECLNDGSVSYLFFDNYLTIRKVKKRGVAGYLRIEFTEYPDLKPI